MPQPLRVSELRTEYLDSPLGLDVAQPRLSWWLLGDGQNERQSAYHVLVATSPDALMADRGDAWDSGRQLSDQSVGVVYAGAALVSRQRYYWKVRIWDNSGAASDWSEPAWWEMGLLEPADWRAAWIGYPVGDDADRRAPDLTDVAWIWQPGAQRCVFEHTFELADTHALRAAVFAGQTSGNFSLSVNGFEVGRVPGRPNAAPIDCLAELQSGRNVLTLDAAAPTMRPAPPALRGRLELRYADGTTRAIDTGASGWTNAVGVDASETPSQAPAVGPLPAPSPYLRTSFRLNATPSRARLYATALGLYDLRINGAPISDALFEPGWTDYRVRVQYRAYDVTSLVHAGDNAIAAVLGSGWYAGYLGFDGSERYGTQPALLAQLEVEMPDGSTSVIVSDTTWRAAAGAIRAQDLQMGEAHDLRLAAPGWDAPGFDDSSWSSAQAHPAEDVGTLVAHLAQPARITSEHEPLNIVRDPRGNVVVDFGQNLVGWVRFRTTGAAGTRITLRFAEALEPDSSIYTRNLRGARAMDEVILSGNGVEVFEPRFTFHGFRYVEIRGATSDITADDITACAINSDTPFTSELKTSHAPINRLIENIRWGQRGNFLSVPTDCPQRDERLGWTGDAQVFVRTASFNMDVSAFFTKWLRDLADAQLPTGAFPHYAPAPPRSMRREDLGRMANGAAAWADAGVIVPWTLYRVYGDTRIIEEHFSNMVRWVDFMVETSADCLRPALGFGDWLSIDADTPKDLIGTAYFAHCATLLGRMATVIGRDSHASKYAELAERVRRAFNAAYVGPDAHVKGETQTGYVLALAMELLPESQRAAAAAHLVEDIRRRGNRLSTGFVGVSLLLPALSEAGYDDVAYALLFQREFPSWLYSVDHGATTIWERWDGWTAERGFQTEDMNSFNHYSLGSVGEWMHRYMAGIDVAPEAEAAGYRRVLIRPRPGGGLESVRTTFTSVYGHINTDWTHADDRFSFSVTLPPNTSGTVHMPGDNATCGTRDGVRQTGPGVFEIGSGVYEFSALIRESARRPG